MKTPIQGFASLLAIALGLAGAGLTAPVRQRNTPSCTRSVDDRSSLWPTI